MAMKQIKVSEATELQLDWLVAKCLGFDPEEINTKTGCVYSLRYGIYRPSIDWAQGGPIIDREKITLAYGDEEEDWFACVGDSRRFYTDSPDGLEKLVGPTPLIAAMRCYVASKLGGTVEVPEELL